MAQNPDLEARIAANPDDVSTYLVYSDWLTEHGDPRGELIALQARLRENPTSTKLRAEVERILETHRSALLGGLHSCGPKDLWVGWKLGFVEKVRFGPPLGDYATSDVTSFAERYEALLALPLSSLVREVVFGGKDGSDYPTCWDSEIEAIATHGVPARLRRLSFDCGGYWDISSTELGTLGVMSSRLGSVEEIHVRMGALSFGDFASPRLKKLDIETGGLRAANITELIASRLPKLEQLDLCIGGSGNYGCDVTLEDVEKLIEALPSCFPALRHLGLLNTELADDIAERLPRSKILPQLKSLSLALGTVGSRGARAVLQNSKAFTHLETIDLTHHYIANDLCAELLNLGPEVILDDPQGDEEDPNDRYVSISE